MIIPQTKITHDYNKFKNLFINRSIQKKNLANIKQSMARNNLLAYRPLICFKNKENDEDVLEIIDGNHRYHSARELNLPIAYLELDKFDLQMLIDLNFSLSKWGTYQFLEAYCKLEKPEYVKFRKFQEDYKLDLHLALPLTKRFGHRRLLNETFRKGEFVFENEREIRQIVENTQEFLAAGKEMLIFVKSAKKYTEFYDAYAKLMDQDGFDQQHMLNQLRRFATPIAEKANMTSYYVQLNALYKRKS